MQNDDIRQAIRKKYSAAAVSVAGMFSYPTGKEGALALGYDRTLVEAADPGMLASFCGVGNPFSLVPIDKGAAVLDIGCGGGFDLYVASRLVGQQGFVQGVDLTSEMVARAADNLSRAGVANAAVLHVGSEVLPFKDSTFDVVISNGVINLSPDKAGLFSEIERVLRPGGRLGFADIVLEKELPPDMAASPDAWAQ